jgi:predicted transcriptional regulator
MELTIVRDEDRLDDQTLKPEVRERVKREIAEYMAKMGSVNTMDIAKKINLSYNTTRKYINEITDEWIDEESNQIIVQIRWLERALYRVEMEPAEYGIPNEREKIRFKLELLNEMNRLRSILFVIRSRWMSEDAMNMKLFGEIRPRTKALLKLKSIGE